VADERGESPLNVGERFDREGKGYRAKEVFGHDSRKSGL
jgi:hypothetical protein